MVSKGCRCPKTGLASVHRRTVRRQRIRMIVTYALLGVRGVVVLFLYWMVLTSLKSYSAYSSESIPEIFTLHPSPENYREAFTAVPLARYFLNTLIFTLATTAPMLIVIVFSAFALRDWNSRGGTSCLRHSCH